MFQIFEQQFILKHASGEYDSVDLVFHRQFLDRLTQSCGDTALEGARNLLLLQAPQAIANYGMQQRTEIEFGALKRKRIRIFCLAAARQVLHPHRRLALEADGTRKAKKSGDGVEQSSCRG